MPAQLPRASFDPIAPDFDLSELVEETPNFQYAPRIPCDLIKEQGIEAFEKAVLLHVILGGKPLVVEGFHHQLDQWTFTPAWLQDNLGQKVERSRNLTTQEDLPLTIAHYLRSMPVLANQWNEKNYKDPDRQRIYLKDIDCPEVWHDKLKEKIPPFLFYLNETTGDLGARAGDLMSSLPLDMRAENMMCYIGHEGTYTPAHREMCASLGQNIMVEASNGLSRDGKLEKPGSSIWFMTESKDRHLVSEYWLSVLGHDIEVESHFAQVNAWKQAPFTTYVVEQKVGDFILIPPLAPHQVWNRGTRTMKAAWNRTTVETLEMALHEALPRARMVCRDEQYKNKAIVYYTLNKYSDLLRRVEIQRKEDFAFNTERDLMRSPKIRQLFKDFKRLFKLYTTILLSEMFSPDSPAEKHVQFLPFDSNVTCAYCRSNIFNRFLTCSTCIIPLENGEEDNYDVCMDCFTMGRSCGCLSKFKWVEQFQWKDLVQKYDDWRHQIISLDGAITEKSPQPLDEERKRLGKKTLAQICQEQLKIRPWRDINKPPSPREEEPEEDLDNEDDETPKRRRKKRRSQKWLKENLNCHICKNREEKWKLAHCECGLYYCYGSLFRAFDLMPQTVMENPNWRCPKCLKICSCGACRKNPDQNPFEPRGTLLGHDTKRIADARSIESLVDFGHSNLKWLKSTAREDEPHETGQLRRKREEAEQAKSHNPTLDDHYVEDWE
ncbi:JmjC domain protein, partial [Xylona heveae TC161]